MKRDRLILKFQKILITAFGIHVSCKALWGASTKRPLSWGRRLENEVVKCVNPVIKLSQLVCQTLLHIKEGKKNQILFSASLYLTFICTQRLHHQSYQPGAGCASVLCGEKNMTMLSALCNQPLMFMQRYDPRADAKHPVQCGPPIIHLHWGINSVFLLDLWITKVPSHMHIDKAGHKHEQTGQYTML